MAAKNEKARPYAFGYVDRNADAVAMLGDSLFYFGELGMQEHESAALLAGTLERAGFAVERGAYGFPTAFVATFGSGAPVIAIHTEYDANPDNSQQSGVAERRPIVEGAPGHCEGHNLNAAVMVGGAIAAARAIERLGIGGTIRVVGAPAEEQLVSRPYLVRDGCFDGVDVAFHTHVDQAFRTGYGQMLSAAVSATFTFRGETAHAAVAPWKGRDALDAVMLMDMGIAQFREHMEPTMRCHRVVTDGGNQPNVIPATATVWWYFRDPTSEGARRLFERARDIAQGAALMTRTEVEVEVLSAVWPVRGNETAARVVQRNVERVGMPGWTEAEQDLARAVQRKAGVDPAGLRTMVEPLTGPAPIRAAANDAGDVSWVVPTGHVRFPANIPGITNHHWTAGVTLAMSIGHKAAVAGAKVLAGSVLDFLLDPGLVAEAKQSFAHELGDVRYVSLLPPDQTPPVDLNRAKMEAFRSLMRPHYVSRKPAFSSA